VSQPLSPNPAPADVAGTLAATRVAQPDLTNRKEIPLSSFDFLAGAYRATKRARSVSIGVLVIVALLGFFNVFRGFRTGLEASDVRRQITEIESSRKSLIEEFGASATDIPTADILDRDRLISSGLVTVTASQGDFSSLLGDLSAIQGGAAGVNGFVFGSAVKLEDEEKKFEVPENAMPVRITVIGTDIAAVVSLAEKIRAVEGLSNVRISRENTTAIILATVPANKPPTEVVQRLIDLGVQFRVASTKPSDAASGTETTTQDGQDTDQGEQPDTTTPSTEAGN
jgi:hypothetical protein